MKLPSVRWLFGASTVFIGAATASRAYIGTTNILYLLLSLALYIVGNLMMLKLTPRAYRRSFQLNVLVSQLIIFPFWLDGVLIPVQGEASLYWLVPGILFSFIKTIYDIWILIIEINR